MLRKKNLKWKPVNIEGIPLTENLEGLIGIEELAEYDTNDVVTPKSKKRKLIESNEPAPKNKKIKVVHGPKSEVVSSSPGSYILHPRLLEKSNEPSSKPKRKKKRKSNNEKKQKVEVGVTINQEKCEVADLENWNSFGLPEPLLCALADQGFKQPTPIQALTLPAALLGQRDILGAAETGSGKTLAFGLPILSGILKLKSEQSKDDDVASGENSDESEFEEDELIENTDGIGLVRTLNNVSVENSKLQKPLYALILTPTRELAVQVKNHLVSAAKYTGIKIAVVLGGMAAVKQERILSKGPEIVVATPGRLWELIREQNPHLSQIDNIRFLAIDETDRMIERGHFQELHQLLERVNADERKRKLRQNFVFSATLTLVHDLPQYLQTKKKIKARGSRRILRVTPGQKLQQVIEMLGISDPKVVDITKESGTVETLTESKISCGIDEKDYYLYYFLQRHPGRTLVFCNSIGCVKRLSTLFALLGCSPLPLHASMQQRQRLKNLERFRDNPQGLLIATDVAARGLDIPNIEHVIHYQTPRTSESYVHRSGRTARASKEGITVLLVEPNELNDYIRLCQTLGRTQELPLFPVADSLLTVVKQRVNLARELDRLELQARRVNKESGWLQKAARDMDILLDDDLSSDEETREKSKLKRHTDIKRKQLAAILAKPLFPHGFSSKYPTSTGTLSTPFEDQLSEKAINVLRISVENTLKTKKKNKHSKTGKVVSFRAKKNKK